MDLVHHVTARGRAGGFIFLDDTDRADYLERLGAVVGIHGWRCLAYCLMGNHTHLLVEAPRAPLRSGVALLRRAHQRAFHLRHGRCDRLWDPAARPVRVRDDRQLWAVAAYIAANPVAAGLCRDAEAWAWGSHAAVAGRIAAPTWLDVARLLELLGGGSPGARRRYLNHVSECDPPERPGPLARWAADH